MTWLNKLSRHTAKMDPAADWNLGGNSLMQIFITDEQTECIIDHDKLEDQIRSILIALDCEEKEISVL